MDPKPKKMPSTNDGGSVKIPALPPAAPQDDDTSKKKNEAAANANEETSSSSSSAARPYVYRDFAQDDTDYGGDTEISVVDGRGLTNQKLPAKLGAMLSDPDLVTCITWMPHGRSWKILNRDLFSRYALPKYFGHTNHASFIRIVNAWGFRRVVTTGPDRDTYYHELFLRGKHNLHIKMKRLPTTHRKTPMDKNETSPNFYELSERSPLPENVWVAQTGVANRGAGSSMGMVDAAGYAGMMGAAAGMGPPGMGGGMMNSMNSRMQLMHQQQQQHLLMGQPMSGMMPGMGMMAAPFAYPPVNVGGVGGSPQQQQHTAASIATGGKQHAPSENDTLTHLQRENDTLMRQLLQLQNQMNPPTASPSKQEDTSAVTALQRDNERLIRQVMELQEQLPQELRMQIPMELLAPAQQSPAKKGKSDGKGGDNL